MKFCLIYCVNDIIVSGILQTKFMTDRFFLHIGFEYMYTKTVIKRSPVVVLLILSLRADAIVMLKIMLPFC